jgi:hypothetical protein
LANRLAAAAVAADLAESGITSTIQVTDFFLLGDRAVADYAQAGRINSDDHPRLEFLAPRTLRRKQSWEENFAALRQAREPLDPYVVEAGPAERQRIARWYEGTTYKLAGQSFELEGRMDLALQAYDKGVALNPEDSLAQIRLRRLRRALAQDTPGQAAPPGRK